MNVVSLLSASLIIVATDVDGNMPMYFDKKTGEYYYGVWWTPSQVQAEINRLREWLNSPHTPKGIDASSMITYASACALVINLPGVDAYGVRHAMLRILKACENDPIHKPFDFVALLEMYTGVLVQLLAIESSSHLDSR